MKPRPTTTLYWSITVLFCLLMLMDGFAGVLRVEGGQVAMRHLGYPVYAMTILGTAKILGALALLQPRYHTLKEWAFAGFTINFIGAAASTGFVGDGLGGVAPALVMLGVLCGLYLLWKQYRTNARLQAA